MHNKRFKLTVRGPQILHTDRIYICIKCGQSGGTMVATEAVIEGKKQKCYKHDKCPDMIQSSPHLKFKPK